LEVRHENSPFVTRKDSIRQIEQEEKAPSSSRSDGLNLAVGFGSLKIKHNNVGAGFPRPIASIKDRAQTGH